jgi:predicted ATPase/DNA-binding SARP family transcriptional activator
MDLSVHLLAGVRVVRDGRERVVTSRRQRAIVAALALSPGRPVSIDELIDALWGEDPPAGARSTIQSYVSRLRSVLGEDAVLFGPGGYRMPAGTTSDAEMARLLAGEARRVLASDPQRAVDAAQKALGLWEGRALSELADEPWFVPAVAGFDELRANLIDTAAEAMITAGRSSEAVELLEPVTRSDPLREPAHVLLVDALNRSGRAVDAVRVARRYRRRLAGETGLEPGVAMAESEQRALAGAPGDQSPLRRRSGGEQPIGPRSAAGGADRLIGRDNDLIELTRALHSARLVAVCGPGGVGKTRLAVELAGSSGGIADAIVVDLTSATADDVFSMVGAALGLHGELASASSIAEHLRDSDAMLVLDGAEHVRNEVRVLVRLLLERCRQLRVLVTTRVRLDLPDEYVHVLRPLSTAGNRPAALELLNDRLARAGRPHDVDAAADLLAICTRLDGVPLALELAAGRIAVLGIEGVRDRLDGALDLIASDGDDRHASLRHVVAWSYELLDEPARALLAALAVFEGEFDLDAAEHVGSTAVGMPVSLLLGRLVDTSLVATTAAPGRYRLLDMIRHFGRERLAASADGDRARAAHVSWLHGRLDGIAHTVGSDEREVAERLGRLRDEVRGAIRWIRARRDPVLAADIVAPLAGPLLYRPDAELIAAAYDLVATLAPDAGKLGDAPAALAAAGSRLAFLAGDLDAVDDLAARALDRDGDAATRHRASHACGVRDLYQGRHADAARAFRSVAEDEHASLVDRLDALSGLGLALCYGGHLSDARTVIERHRAIAEVVDSDTHRAFADYVRGELDIADGDIYSAARHLREAAARAWSVGATFVWGVAATVLGRILVRQGTPSVARDHLLDVLRRLHRTAAWTQLWTTLRLVAELLVEDDAALAALILVAADRDAAAPKLAGRDAERDTELRQLLRQRFGAARFAGTSAGAASLARGDVFDRAVDAVERLDAS